jgi:hypothetical protein
MEQGIEDCIYAHVRLSKQLTIDKSRIKEVLQRETARNVTGPDVKE